MKGCSCDFCCCYIRQFRRSGSSADKYNSDFGAHYDSLADIVSFGVAPAVVGYLWLLKDLGKLGWFAVFLYVAATALRLARFNIIAPKSNNGFFYGLPCPAAAMLIATFIWTVIDFGDFDTIYFSGPLALPQPWLFGFCGSFLSFAGFVWLVFYLIIVLKI